MQNVLFVIIALLGGFAVGFANGSIVEGLKNAKKRAFLLALVLGVFLAAICLAGPSARFLAAGLCFASCLVGSRIGVVTPKSNPIRRFLAL